MKQDAIRSCCNAFRPTNSRPIPAADVPSPDVTRLLARWKDGDGITAAARSDRPRGCEGWRGDRWRGAPGHTLQPTALVKKHTCAGSISNRCNGRTAPTFRDGRPTDAAHSRGPSDRAVSKTRRRRAAGLVHAGAGSRRGPADRRGGAQRRAFEALADVDERKSWPFRARFFGGLSVEERPSPERLARQSNGTGRSRRCGCCGICASDAGARARRAPAPVAGLFLDLFAAASNRAFAPIADAERCRARIARRLCRARCRRRTSHESECRRRRARFHCLQRQRSGGHCLCHPRPGRQTSA